MGKIAIRDHILSLLESALKGILIGRQFKKYPGFSTKVNHFWMGVIVLLSLNLQKNLKIYFPRENAIMLTLAMINTKELVNMPYTD